MRGILSAIAGLLCIVGFIPYIVAVVRTRTWPLGTPGKAEPRKSTWIIWAGLDTITLAGMFAEHAVNGQILGSTIGAWIVAGLALKYGSPGWTKLDKFCLAGAVLGIALWQAFDDPILGIVTSLSTVFLGSIPTFASAWKDPSRENKLAWTIFFAACVFAIIAIPQWTLADAAQPITFAVVETAMMYILFRPTAQVVLQN